MPPVYMLIKPASSLCNMRCRYCFYADVSKRRTQPSYGIMSAETADVLVRQALEYAQGQCTFAFQGGEPTLASLDFFRNFVGLVERYNTRRVPVHFAIQTNGLMIDAEWASFLAKHRFLAGLSLDGNAQIHNDLRPDARGKGTYSRALHAAEILRKHGCEYNILCVVTQPVARHAASVYNGLKRHQYLQFIPCIDDFDGPPSPLSLTPLLLGQFLKVTFDLYYNDAMSGRYVSVRTFDNYVRMCLGHPPESCAMNGACTCSLIVEGNGSVYPCDFYVLDRWRLGNLHEDTIAKMLAGPRAAAFVEDSQHADPACAQCQWYALCRGGCRRDRELPGQAGLGPNKFCEAYRTFFAHAYDRLIEMARLEARSRAMGR